MFIWSTKSDVGIFKANVGCEPWLFCCEEGKIFLVYKPDIM